MTKIQPISSKPPQSPVSSPRLCFLALQLQCANSVRDSPATSRRRSICLRRVRSQTLPAISPPLLAGTIPRATCTSGLPPSTDSTRSSSKPSSHMAMTQTSRSRQSRFPLRTKNSFAKFSASPSCSLATVLTAPSTAHQQSVPFLGDANS
jgi:hypothetical protein